MIPENILNSFSIRMPKEHHFEYRAFYDMLFSDSHVPQIMINQIHQVESLRTMDPVNAIKPPLLGLWRTLVLQKSTSNQIERDQQEHGVFRLIHTEISGSWMVILWFDLCVLNPNMMVGGFLVPSHSYLYPELTRVVIWNSAYVNR
jgi:hypothetical protein